MSIKSISTYESIVKGTDKSKKSLLFEFGKTYKKNGQKFKEDKKLNLFIVGNKNTEHWTSQTEKADFFYLKGILKSIFNKLGMDFSVEICDSDVLSEGLLYTYKNNEIAKIGRLSGHLTNKFDIEEEVLFADIKWDSILKIISKINFQSQEIPKFPEVRRDFALLLDEKIKFNQIE